MRAVHLYTGLLLVPWMAMYATSAFCLNHNRWFTPWLGKPQSWETVRAVKSGLAGPSVVPGAGFAWWGAVCSSWCWQY